MILQKLEYPATKAEIEQMIWEVDEDLNEHVDMFEFELMYKRCIIDKTGLEPRYFDKELFNKEPIQPGLILDVR